MHSRGVEDYSTDYRRRGQRAEEDRRLAPVCKSYMLDKRAWFAYIGDMTITRHDGERYSVITDTVLSDGSQRMDTDMRLDGHELRSHEQHGYIRVAGLLRVTLGPKAYAIISTLPIGETVTL